VWGKKLERKQSGEHKKKGKYKILHKFAILHENTQQKQKTKKGKSHKQEKIVQDKLEYKPRKRACSYSYHQLLVWMDSSSVTSQINTTRIRLNKGTLEMVCNS
jgi:hypothetical protein